MKKSSKKVNPKKTTRTKDNLFTKNVISLDDKNHLNYFDDLSYQQYLSNLKNERRDLYGKK